MNFLGVHESLESKLGNISRRRTLLLQSLTIYFLWGQAMTRKCEYDTVVIA